MLTPIGLFPSNIDHRRALEARYVRLGRLCLKASPSDPTLRKSRLGCLLEMTECRRKGSLYAYVVIRRAYLATYKGEAV